MVKQTQEATGIFAPVEVWAGGCYQGGLSWDGRYLTTAESSPHVFLLDLQNPQNGPRTLHRLPVKKVDTGVIRQSAYGLLRNKKLCRRLVAGECSEVHIAKPWENLIAFRQQVLNR